MLVEKLEHFTLFWENKLVRLLWKTVRKVLKKLNIELYDPAISISGCTLKRKSGSRRHICIFMFMVALFPAAKIWKQSKCPSMDKWVKKMWYRHTMEYHSALKKKEILPFAMTWTNLKDIRWNEISNRRRTTIVWFHLYGESKIVKAESAMVAASGWR